MKRNAFMRIGDFTYTDGDPIFNIQYDKEKYVIPETLYKYYALSKNSIEAITTPYLYASHPNQLNDPLDCHKDIVVFDDEETLKALWEPLYENVLQELGAELMHEKAPSTFKTINYRKCGIISLTEHPDNELMWSHYAQKDGFCVELDIKSMISSFDNEGIRAYGPFPINYQEKLPRIRMSRIGARAAMAMQCTVKRKAWSYENEWRLIVTNRRGQDFKGFGNGFDGFNFGDEYDRKIKYSIKSIKKIIFQQTFLDCEKILSNKDGIVEFESRCLCKRKLLDFAIENHIPTSMRLFLPPDSNEEILGDSIYSVRFSKIDDTKYSIVEI